MIFYQFGQRGFVSGHITQFRAMFERKRRGGGGVIEADRDGVAPVFPFKLSRMSRIAVSALAAAPSPTSQITNSPGVRAPAPAGAIAGRIAPPPPPPGRCPDETSRPRPANGRNMRRCAGGRDGNWFARHHLAAPAANEKQNRQPAGADCRSEYQRFVQSWAIALSIAAKSWLIVASVSSPMFETRNVVPLILP